MGGHRMDEVVAPAGVDSRFWRHFHATAAFFPKSGFYEFDYFAHG
jgi:hypothetical protein